MSIPRSDGYDKGVDRDLRAADARAPAGADPPSTCSKPPRSSSPATASTARRSTTSPRLAGFTKGAVYSNFKSKDDLFLALLDDRVESQFAVTTEVLESGPHDRADQFPRCASHRRHDLRATTPSRRCTSSSCSTRAGTRKRGEKLIAERAARARADRGADRARSTDTSTAAAPYPMRALAEFSRARLQRSQHDPPRRSRSRHREDARLHARDALRGDGRRRGRRSGSLIGVQVSRA